MNFIKLQKQYFQFMLPTFVSPMNFAIADVFIEARRKRRFLNIGVAGLSAFDAERKRRRKTVRQVMMGLGTKVGVRSRRGDGKAGTMVAYEELNDIVRHALQQLQRRERRRLY